MTVNIELEPIAQEVASGWTVFHLKRLEVSVMLAPQEYENRKVTAEFETPEAHPLRIAIPLFPGSGTQPDNTLTLTNVQEQAQQMIQQLEDAILETIQQKGDF